MDLIAEDKNLHETVNRLEAKIDSLPTELSQVQFIELHSLKIEKSVMKRYRTGFGVFLGILSIAAIIGYFGFRRDLTFFINASLRKEVAGISESVRIGVEGKVKEFESKFKELDNKVKSTESRVEEAERSANYRLDVVNEEIARMKKRIFKAFEIETEEFISKIEKKLKEFEDKAIETERKTEKQFAASKKELEYFSKLMVIIKSSLSRKIETLQGLTLNLNDEDVEIQRYIAALVLKDLEDVELVKKQELTKKFCNHVYFRTN